jgi:hypothetical protein
MDCPLLVFSQELHTQVTSTLFGYCEAMGRFLFRRRKKEEKKQTPSPQGMYIDSLSCLHIPPLQVLKISLKPPLRP